MQRRGAAEDELCKSFPFKPLLAQQFPPIKVEGLHMPRVLLYHGQEYPLWQPLDQALTPNAHVFAMADEFSITLPWSLVQRQGWKTLGEFVRAWLTDLSGTVAGTEGGRVVEQHLVCEAGRGAATTGASSSDRPDVTCPGCVLRCDLHDLHAGQQQSQKNDGDESIRVCDWEVVETGWGEAGSASAASIKPYFRLAAIASVADDGVPRRNPFPGVREFGAFVADSEASFSSAPSVGGAGRPSGSRSSGAQQTKEPANDDLVTFYTRGLHAVDGGAVDMPSLTAFQHAMRGMIAGIGERFGMKPSEADASIRGFHGRAGVAPTAPIAQRPACFAEQRGTMHEDMSQALMQGSST